MSDSGWEGFGSAPGACGQYRLEDPHPHPHLFRDPHHIATPVGDTPLETRRERPISSSRGVNRPVGPRPRRWGWGS
eukprot:7130698-Pyramimonas_sp.AAC.1